MGYVENTCYFYSKLQVIKLSNPFLTLFIETVIMDFTLLFHKIIMTLFLSKTTWKQVNM